VYKPWVAAFNDLWTNDNLDVIKLMAKAKVLAETRPYRCQMTADAEGNIIPAEDDSDTFAWQACDNMNTFGQLLGKVYVAECLPANSKENLTQLSEQIVSTYKDLIRSTAWMSEDSKKSVIEKLDNMTLNVLEPTGGYFDYSGIELTPTDKGGTLFSNYLACKQYRYDCEAKLVGAPAIAASPWFSLTPSTLNAFYDGEGNSINILPGFTTTLTYGDKMANEDLLAGIGFAIAHEVSHGFDYLGAQLDAYGQPNHVYSDADVDKFLAKAAALAEYYSGIELQPDVMVDGQNVVTEAGADL
jgi:putative endopeptidase